MTGPGNAEIIGRFLEATAERPLPSEVLDAAKRCLLDWIGVTVAGGKESVVKAALAYAGLDGTTLPVVGPFDDPEKAALVNGAAAHALDFDDTHIPTDSHISAVTWSTLFAMADPQRHDGCDLLCAFVAGYEVAAKLSDRRFGFSLQFRWFHPTAVIGRLASSAAAAALMGLDATRAAQAVTLSATQASGLRGTLGGMGNPMQVGAAARDGIACARMAAASIEIDTDLLSPRGGFIRAFVQDESAQLADLSQTSLGQDWAVLRTSFKPYACLHGIHPSIDAAIELAPQVDAANVKALRVSVAPGVKKVARFEAPATTLEAKFSVHFCVAAALMGHRLGADSFTDEVLSDPLIISLMSKLEVVAEEGRKMLDSAVDITLESGRQIRAETTLSRGHPGNPLTWEELNEKFFSLVEPVHGTRAREIGAVLKSFDVAGALENMCALLQGSERPSLHP